MGISVPPSWIPGLQATCVILLAGAYFFDQPLVILGALAFSALAMTQDDAPAAIEHKPITAIIALSGLLFLADYADIAWGLALFAALLGLVSMFGLRPYYALLSRLTKDNPGSRQSPPSATRRRS